MFEQDKKLEDYQKNHPIIDRTDFEKMSYKEKLKLHETNPDEYRRLTHQIIQKTTGHTFSSQTRR